MALEIAKWIPWLPALAAVLCGICCAKPSLRKFAGVICLASIAASFGLSLVAGSHIHHDSPARIVQFWNWIHVGEFAVNFAYYFDSLTIIMLYVVTGIGSLVAWYAIGYMKGERGFARFFFGVSLFIFAMTTLVMADNLVLMFLGWEGVGLCSYLLIGYYYDKPSAVAAGKKAFIVNRVGDLAFVLGMFLTYKEFGTLEFAPLFDAVHGLHGQASATAQWIPWLLMLGAFGKSAQLPLYVWLPDAMEGPTPVSALIHAATMVTAGVYLIARMMPVFQLAPQALEMVALVGGLTAFFAATIALCQYDIKRIYAYSTISQLGYMFVGVGAMSTVGGVFHLYTHAFFKALLFLTAGSVMHGMAGQLDLRKMSGLRHKMPVTCWLMFAGCLALAGVPPLAGFFSKDLILADVMARGLAERSSLWQFLATLGLITAFLTAYYTFRLWFRVFWGPEQYEMGAEHHGDDDHSHDNHGHDSHAHAPQPHEMPLSMNLPLVFLAVGAVAAGFACKGWMAEMVNGSSAAVHVAEHGAHGDEGGVGHVALLGLDVHSAMALLSFFLAVGGISLAALYHLLDRPAADALKRQYRPIVRLLENKYYVDEIYHRVIVRSLKFCGYMLYVIDRLVIDSLVSLVGFVPRLLGLALAPAQRGALQGYGLGMVVGVALLVVMVVMGMAKAAG